MIHICTITKTQATNGGERDPSWVQLANQNQLGDHYGSKHPKEKPPSESG
ncbi:hypothetical protein IC582_016865 [Cucumis melo]